MRTAFEIGVPPHRFWRMTLRTFLLCFEGYHRRQHDDMRRRAWEVAHHINLWAKEPVSPAALLGESKPAPMFATPDDFHAHMRAKKRKAAEKRKRMLAKGA